MYFSGALPEQKESAPNKDQIPAGDFLSKHGEKWFSEADDPGEEKQEADAHEHGEEQANSSRGVTALMWKLVHQNRNEDHVVDPENEFESGERKKGDPYLRIGEQFGHVGGIRMSRLS
jgi:hypothetical protein